MSTETNKKFSKDKDNIYIEESTMDDRPGCAIVLTLFVGVIIMVALFIFLAIMTIKSIS